MIIIKLNSIIYFIIFGTGTRDEYRRVWGKKEERQKSNRNVDKTNDSEGEKDANDDEPVVHLKTLSSK